MGTKSKIDVGAMLLPISEDKPAGAEVREAKDYALLEEARKEEVTDNVGEWEPANKKVADWAKVVSLGTKILTKEGKDLQVAVRLTEALIRRHGFAGLRDGIRIIKGFHEHFWETMFPVLEDDDLDHRSGILEILNKTAPYLIKDVPLTHPKSGEYYSYWQYQESLEVENMRRGAASNSKHREHLQALLEVGKLEGEKFDNAVMGTPLSHLSALLQDLTESLEEVQELESLLEQKYAIDGDDKVTMRPIKIAVEECQSLIDALVKKKGGPGLGVAESKEVEGEHMEPQSFAESATTSSGSMSGGREPQDRVDAIRRLQEIAVFFNRTEPHSPISYLVQRAARWGEMPLSEWLQEVIKNDDILDQVNETLGIKEVRTTNSDD